MKRVFADTCFWIAFINQRDSLHEKAVAARESLGEFLTVTTDEVMTEFLAGFSSGGDSLRKQAARMVRTILDNPNVRVIPQTRLSFLDGLELYEQRTDKKYSLTDCTSMKVMQKEGISEVLTEDHHFEQENFTILMK